MTSLESMGIREEQARAAARFLNAYANTVYTELEDLSIRAREEEPTLWWDVDPFFGPAADAASALREAAQWLMYLDPQAALRALAGAGSLFLRLREPFGLYLLTLVGVGDLPLPVDEEATLAAMLDTTRDDMSVHPAALHIEHPQQQAYVVLALSSRTSPEDPTGVLLDRVLESSPHREGAAMVGALGTPIHLYWDMATHLFRNETPDDRRPGSGSVVAAHVAAMSRQYAETMRTAQGNQYLWSRGLSPVDVGDIDIAGISCLAARRLGVPWMYDAMQRLEPIAAAPIQAGLALNQASGGQQMFRNA
jgi:hypothetical protein